MATGTPSLPLMLGIYTTKDLYSTAASEVAAMDTWLASNGASGLSLAGDFLTVTFNPAWTMSAELEAAWSRGFVPFVNFMLSEQWEAQYGYYDLNCATATAIASGNCDGKLAVLADSYKAWAVGGRKAYFAPMPEMNSDWAGAAYGTDSSPTAYIDAYKRMRQVFAARGVPASTLQWVFAPNGWHDPAFPIRAFENYYPGDNVVDVVGFSAYNYGGCPADAPWRIWDTFETAMAPYLQRMRLMAPGKPIFIAQTGVVNVPNNPANAATTENKSYWLQDTFGKLANYPAVRAIVYFNLVKAESTLPNCPTGADYLIYRGAPTNAGEPGLTSIMKDSRLGKWSANDSRWNTIAFAATPAYSFNDVKSAHPFSGETLWYFDSVEKMKAHGVTNGCSPSPPLYCPADATTRAQMAVFLLRAIHGSGYSPPAVGSGTGFADVPTSHWAAASIKQFAAEGITAGCGGGNYCPEASVTRAQMAVFLLRSKHGSAYVPPGVGSGTGFADVSVTHWAADWIKQLAAEGITTGCGGGNYCPDQAVTRAQMAAFISRTFGW